MNRRNFTIIRRDFQKETFPCPKTLGRCFRKYKYFHSVFLYFFNKNLGIFRLRNKFVKVLHGTKQILICLVNVMLFLAAPRGGFRNTHKFPIHVIKVSYEKLLQYVSQLKLLKPVLATKCWIFLLPENTFNN